MEIDGASNRGIEEIRNLRELIKFSPMNSSYKIFIIDEVHMLTNQAFNALLRTLEEPPAHGKFIMCTTDIHKVPDTIISRCQRFDFNRISINDIKESVNSILSKEKINSDLESVEAIAVKSEGSMRDALSILDQIIAFSDNKINYKDVEKILGLVSSELYFRLTNSINDKNSDRDIKDIATKEFNLLKEDINNLETEIQFALLPKDISIKYFVILVSLKSLKYFFLPLRAILILILSFCE